MEIHKPDRMFGVYIKCVYRKKESSKIGKTNTLKYMACKREVGEKM